VLTLPWFLIYKGWTPLHEACWRGSPDAVELLLSHMKKFPRPDGTSLVEWVPSAGRRVARDSRNPLFIAAQFSDIKIVEALLARKDFSRYISQKCYGLTPLEVATLVESRSNSRNPTAVRELLQKYTNEKVGTHDVLYAKVLDATRPAACTFTLTGRHFAAQHYWTCSDCHSEPSRGAHDRGKYICATCIEQCHSGHNIVYGGILLTFCRCGSSPLRNCKASPHYEH
jgi:ankyrin repeat protein